MSQPCDSSQAVVLSKISKSYPSLAQRTSISTPNHVIKDLSLKISRGSSLALTGPSGSGKTTLLNLIGTLLRPDTGEIEIDDIKTTTLSGEKLAEFRNKHIGFLFQDHRLIPQCDVIENILLPTLAFQDSTATSKGLDKNEKLDRAHELLTFVGLATATHSFPDELSGGEKQRVALIRALINNPPLLLADEPTGSLDADNAKRLAELMFEMNHSKKHTLVIATHSASLAEKAESRLEMGKKQKKPLSI